jgi:drug/metabolite transporter (DMT)-like permease
MLLIAGCAISYAGYITGSSRIIPVVGASLFNSLAMLAASAGVLIHFFFAGAQNLSELSAHAWTFGLLMAVFATVIPSYLIAESIRRIGGENTAIIASVGPVTTILMAWWWLGESVTLWQLAGTLCTLTGVWLVSKGK